MKILGIETSADDTGVALMEATGEFETGVICRILANAVDSQAVHAEYGGIYPNLAKREHAKNLPILLERVLGESEANADNPSIDAIAVTVGPGLEPCLWEGIEFAKKLAARLDTPIIPVNHMEGHIIVSLVRDDDANRKQKTENSDTKKEGASVRCSLFAVHFPAVVLLISGGHTELILMREFGAYEYIGRTRDDAVGEAFDKVARMLGLPYPGGPAVSALAESGRNKYQVSSIKLPRPMLDSDDYDFSFAGLKTAVLRLVKERSPLSDDMKRQFAREFEDAAADILAAKTLRAAEEYGANTVIVGGGVSANTHIRRELSSQLEARSLKLFLCPLEFTGDNALMIALAGYLHALNNEYAKPEDLRADGNLLLSKNAGFMLQ